MSTQVDCEALRPDFVRPRHIYGGSALSLFKQPWRREQRWHDDRAGRRNSRSQHDSLQTLIKQYAGCEERGAKPGLGGIICTHFVLCPQHFTLSALKKVKHFLMSTWLSPLCFFMTPPHPLTCLALHRLPTCLSTKMLLNFFIYLFISLWKYLMETCRMCCRMLKKKKNHTQLISCVAEHLIKALWNLLTLPPASAFCWKCHTRKKKKKAAIVFNQANLKRMCGTRLTSRLYVNL